MGYTAANTLVTVGQVANSASQSYGSLANGYFNNPPGNSVSRAFDPPGNGNTPKIEHTVYGGTSPLIEMLGGGPAKGISVLGKYPEYVNLAKQVGGKYFNIPMKYWNKMTASQQWKANIKFLDRAIARGDNFLLSNKVSSLKKISGAFRKELDYLIEKGYKLSDDGLKLFK